MIGAYGVAGRLATDDEIRICWKKAGWLKAPEHDDTPESVKEHINEIYSKLGLDRKL
jgi:hypothetical protein